MGVFLGSHGTSDLAVFVPESGFLNYSAAFRQNLLLSLDFVFQGLLDCLEAVDVFHFGLGAELFAPFGPNGDVGIATKAALLHVAIAYLEILENGPQVSQIAPGFLGAGHIRFRHDLHEGDSRAVQVDETVAAFRIMYVFTRVLFHMDSSETHPFFAAVHLDVNVTVGTKREFILADLITFRQVRVKIVFPRPPTGTGNGAVGGEARANGELHNLFVQHRQNTGKAHAYRAGILVRAVAKSGGTPAKDL